MLTAFNRYICYIKPPANDKEAQEQYVEVKYARARVYFESQHWEEAALGFRDVAMNHAEKDAAIGDRRVEIRLHIGERGRETGLGPEQGLCIRRRQRCGDILEGRTEADSGVERAHGTGSVAVERAID